MTHKRSILLAASSLVATAGVLWTVNAADSEWKLPVETAALKPGPGVEAAAANCLICHSADYISTQPPLERAGWAASVQKMREKYGAPIATNAIDTLVNYLARNYGKDSAR